jgi:hypothetical protein
MSDDVIEESGMNVRMPDKQFDTIQIPVDVWAWNAIGFSTEDFFILNSIQVRVNM